MLLEWTSRQQPLEPIIILCNNKSIAWKGLHKFPFLKVQVQANNKSQQEVGGSGKAGGVGRSVRALAKHTRSFGLISSNNAHTYVHAYIRTRPGKGVCARGTLSTLITILSQAWFFHWQHKQLMKMNTLNRTVLITKANIIYKSPESWSPARHHP